MDLVQLECFSAVAKLGTVTAAAAELRISQPAVTKRLQGLEQELGVTLFLRMGRRLALSRSGELLLPRAQEILTASRALQRAAADAASLRVVRLSVRAGSSLLPPLISRLGETRPELELQVVQERDRSADLTLDAALERTFPPGAQLLLQEQVVLAVPAGHPLAGAAAIRPEDLRGHQLISLCRGRAMRDIEEELCRRAGLSPHRSVECDTPATLRSLVSQGVGIAFAAQQSWFIRPNDRVRLIPLSPRRWRYLTLRPSPAAMDDPFIRALCRDIQAFFRGLAPRGGQGE